VDRRRVGARVGVAGVLVALAVIGGAGPVAARPASPGPTLPVGISDITWTPRGRDLAVRAAERFARMRSTIAAGDLVVLEDGGGVTIGPRAASYAAIADGRAAPAILPTTAARPGLTRGIRRGVLAGIVGGWQFVGNQCFARISDTFTWLDHCYTMYQLSADGDPTRDWYALNHYATMDPNMPWVMNAASIGTTPIGTATQTWADWAPRSSTVSPCRQVAVSVSSPVGGIGDTVMQCEAWTIAKSAAAGAFAVRWDGHGTHATRELSLEIAVSVPQGSWPQWALPASVSGSPF